jgi:hypothetical protein
MSITNEDLRKIIEIVNENHGPVAEEAVRSSEQLRSVGGMAEVLSVTVEALQQHITERIIEQFGDILNGGIEV